MSNIVYINGRFLPQDEAQISIFDRGFLFGDGIYEVIPVIEGCLVDREHALARMHQSLAAIDMRFPCESNQAYLDILQALIAQNNLNEGVVYSQVTRGIAPRDFHFPDVAPSLVAFCSARAIIDNAQAETGIHVVTVQDQRWARRDIKSVNLLGQCLAKQQAVVRKAQEAWMVEDGKVTEGASSSAFIVRDNVLITRALSRQILPGIRRKVILQLAENYQIRLDERPFSVAEARAADEAFISSATALVTPVTHIDGHQVADGVPGPLTRRLRQLYVAQLRKEAAAGLTT